MAFFKADVSKANILITAGLFILGVLFVVLAPRPARRGNFWLTICADALAHESASRTSSQQLAWQCRRHSVAGFSHVGAGALNGEF
jgi:hypothetical protein